MNFTLLISSLACMFASMFIADLMFFSISVLSVFSSLILIFQENKKSTSK